MERLEGAEEAKGVTPDPQVAQLMAGLHKTDNTESNVALTLQARTLSKSALSGLDCRPAAGVLARVVLQKCCCAARACACWSMGAVAAVAMVLPERIAHTRKRAVLALRARASHLSPLVQLLSLVNCADTIVGDGMIRGVSGGEKKRVTTGEIMVGPSRVLFMDKISTGARPGCERPCRWFHKKSLCRSRRSEACVWSCSTCREVEHVSVCVRQNDGHAWSVRTAMFQAPVQP